MEAKGTTVPGKEGTARAAEATMARTRPPVLLLGTSTLVVTAAVEEVAEFAPEVRAFMATPLFVVEKSSLLALAWHYAFVVQMP